MLIKNAQSIVEINQSLTQNQIALQELLANLQAYRGQITRTIYDLPYEPFVLQYSNLLLVQRNLRNRVSYVTYSDTAATSYNTASFYTYDIHGNVDTLLLDYGQSMGAFANIMNKNANRFKKIAYNYDLISGKVNRVAYQHGWADRFYHRYSYDAENRLIKAETSTDSLRWEEDANYQYYLHGPLARTVLGHRQVQGIDYAYTLQGWLKGVNSTGLSAEQDMGGDGLSGGLNQYVAKDAYGFNLYYFTGDYSAINESKNPFPGQMAYMSPADYKPLYNGNISSMAVHNRALDAENLAGGQLLLYNYRYDQLNRITGMDAYNGFDKINNNWQGLTQLNIFKERIAYDPNGNILKYLRHNHRSPYVMDSLSYHYYPGTNRLNHVTDQVAAASFGNGQNDVADIDNQNSDNYHYDETGNLVKDLAEGIDKITWTVYGKITSIEKANGTNIFYTYDPSGNRISKLVQRSTGDKHYTWYVRDAQGNVMATYTAKGNATELSDLELHLSERHLYGSSRLGILTETVDVDNNNTGPEEVEEIKLISYYRGYRLYELSNHLGNVLATVSDKKSGIDSNSDEEIDYFEPEIITASDYYPFGMLMPGRGGSLINGEWQESGPTVLTNLSVDDRTGNQPSEYIALESIEFLPGFESGSEDEFVAYITTSGIGDSEGTDGLYRYGFNGKEMDNETGTQDYGFRIYNPGLGRFLSVDPITKSYPELTPYQFASNNPIFNIDIDGLEGMGSPIAGVRSPTTKKYMIQGDLNNDMIVDASERESWNKAMGVWLIGGGAILTGGRTLPLLKPLFWRAVANPETAGSISVSIFTGLTGYEGPDIPGPGDDAGKAINKISKSAISSLRPIVQKRKDLAKAWAVATDYIDFEEAVSTQTFLEGKILYQYRIPGTEKGSYFVESLDITPEQVGLKSVDYSEVYKVTLTQDAKVLKSTHIKDAPYWRDKTQSTEGGEQQIYNIKIKNTATFEKIEK